MTERKRLPNRRLQHGEVIEWNGGLWRVDVGFDRAGRGCEVFAEPTEESSVRIGSHIRADTHRSCILLSKLLQRGETLAEVQRCLLAGDATTGPGDESLLLAVIASAVRTEATAGEAHRIAYRVIDEVLGSPQRHGDMEG
jgi:hypothetical protein